MMTSISLRYFRRFILLYGLNLLVILSMVLCYLLVPLSAGYAEGYGWYLDGQSVIEGIAEIDSEGYFGQKLTITNGSASGIDIMERDRNIQGCEVIIGAWLRASDKSVVRFKSIGPDEYQANIVELGGLAAYGFSLGEATIKVKCVKPGEYEGLVKWRWTDGREEWRKDKFTVQGDRMNSGIGIMERDRKIQGCEVIIGSWLRASDKSVVRFKLIGPDEYQANIVELGGLAAYGFSLGEATIKVKCVKPGEYEGLVKWRWADGREQWRADRFTVQGDRMNSGIGEFVRR